MSQSLFDRTFKDKNGRWTIWQFPNAFLLGWAGLTFISLFFSANSHIGDVLTWLGSVSLIIWALLEIFRGANYFRRILGLVVLIAAIMTLINNL